MIRVVIADDHPLVRFAVRQSLESEEDLEVLGEATTGEQAVELARVHRPDAVVLDYRMPVMDGMAAAGIIAQELPGVCILMLTGENDPLVMEEASGAGVHGLVQKTAPAETLPRLLRQAMVDRGDLRVVVDPGSLPHRSP